jgi:two-component system chemotaxis sensor kinase CheA
VKGGAGAFGLEALVKFAHVFETALDGVRSGKLEPTPILVLTMLRAADVLADLVSAARDGGEVEEARSATLAEELKALSDPAAGAGAPAPAPRPTPVAAPPALAEDLPGLAFQPVRIEIGEPALPAAPAGPATFTVRFRPHADLYAKGNDSVLLLRELGRLGEVEIHLDADTLPPLAELETEAAHLAWTVTLTTDRSEADILEVFEFVDGECDLSVAPVGDAAPAADDLDLAAILAKAAAVPAEPDLDVMAAFQPLAAPEPDPEPLAATAPTLEPVTLAPPVAVAAQAAPVQAASSTPAHAAPAEAANPTIRVDLHRVDRLIDLVGELVINQAMLNQRVLEAGLARASAVAMGLDELEGLTREIQDSVMAIRAQPVKSVFQRMPRLVREVAAMTGKDVRLVTEGEGTEVDKTVIERLSDPLTHMIRNAIDHGLEAPHIRLAAGKPTEGVVKLSAFHRSGRIVIEVSDDGAGINREVVKSIAVNKGLIAADAALSDEEIDNLIFMPGFSTAKEVSDISGRGVGMDVVRRSIQALGGRIVITSRPGQGSTFTLSLPLTLAVLDGMVVSVSGQTLVAPLTAIIESIKPKPGQVSGIGADAKVIAIRDAYVPLIDIGLMLGFRATPLEPGEGVAILIEGEGGAKAALLVDDILGQRQVVIKSLETHYRQVTGIAAATILGDGRVALILDVDAIVVSSRSPERPRQAQALMAAE